MIMELEQMLIIMVELEILLNSFMKYMQKVFMKTKHYCQTNMLLNLMRQLQVLHTDVVQLAVGGMLNCQTVILLQLVLQVQV